VTPWKVTKEGESNGCKSGLITEGVHTCHRGQPRVKRESRRHLTRLISGRELWSRENRGAYCIITYNCRSFIV